MKKLVVACLAAGLIASTFAVQASGAQGRSDGRTVLAGRGTAAPNFVSGIRDAAGSGPAAQAARRYLSSHEGRYHVRTSALRLMGVARAAGTTTVRFAQRYRGVSVFGAQYLVHLRGTGDDRTVSAVNGVYHTGLRTSTVPRIGLTAARQVALASLRGIRNARVEHHGLTVIPAGPGVLAYHVTVWGSRFGRPLKQEVYVGARSGRIALSYNNLQADAPVTVNTTNAHGDPVTLNVLQTDTGSSMIDQTHSMFDPATGDGVVETHDAGGTPDIEPTPANLVTWTGATVPANLIGDGAVDAHWAAGMVFEWYQAHLGRNSIDDQGMSIVSVANAADPGTGEPMVNAFWDGTKMVYGNPGRGLYPFSASLDVVAHELTHGVTQFSVDPDLSLVYIHQSGAINEATSDYFGNAFQDDTEGITPDDGSWGQLGEDLCVDPTTNGYNVPCPLRDVSDPNAVGLPASTSEYLGLLPDLDNGGVHLDSTIYSSTLWQIRTEMYEAHGGAPGALLADRIVYGAYQYYTPTTDFLAGRAAVTQSAMDLQAQGVLSAADVQVVESAFDDHGIVDGWDADPAGRDSTILVDNDIPLYFFGVNGPRASGHRFVYGDYEDKSSFCCRRQQIYVANTDGSGGPAEIGDTASPATITDDGQPVISGRQIAWTHGVLTPQGVSSRIEGRKLGGPVQTLARAPGSLLLDPALSGRRLAWTRISFPGGGFAEDVYTRRLGGKTVKLSTSGFAAFPATNGRWVTWLDGTARGPAIMAADTRTGRVRTLQQPANATVGPPAINGSTLVFFSDVDSDGTGAIMRWPLGSRQVTKLVSYSDANPPVWFGFSPIPPTPAINRTNAVYASERTLALWGRGYGPNGSANLDDVGRHLYLVSLAGGPTILVTHNGGDQAFPTLAGGRRTIWLDGSQGRTDIMMRESPAA